MVALIDPSFKFQQRIIDTLIWSKLNYIYIIINFLIPIFILCTIAFALKDNYFKKKSLMQLFLDQPNQNDSKDQSA